MSWPSTKKNFTQEKFRKYVATLQWLRWRPSLIVLHNTALPTLAQWHETEAKDKAAGRVPGITRINGLENYFKNDQHWSGCPHLFIADDFIWEMNRLTDPGVHSPSWNGVAIGIEMIADFAKEDDDSGAGLIVRNNTIFATALLCSTLGLDPHKQVKLHKEDPKTTHDCPGEDFAHDRDAVIASIAALMDGGDHDVADVGVAIGVTPPPPKPTERTGIVNADDLTVRRGPGVANEATGHLPKGTAVIILGEAANGATGWFNIRSPGGYTGWVAGRYVSVA